MCTEVAQYVIYVMTSYLAFVAIYFKTMAYSTVLRIAEKLIIMYNFSSLLILEKIEIQP